ncbi:MAG: c-type cytochrome [Candidatus Eisenbacteria bacterium]|nr:c-type cytochrome [Candidatus Eisenbacteria bacterium]
MLSVTASCLAVRPPLSPAERGRRLAERTGCFGCHGPEGLRGAGNPGRTDRTVPGFEDDVMMFAKTRDEIREWIRDGGTAAKRRSRTWRAQREQGALRMPAFGDRLSARQVEDLVAMVEANAGRPEPEDSLALAGRRRAKELGCTGCHGPGGRFQRPNPGSVRGYVPAWDGPDFPELVRDRAEFSEWVERGRSDRFARNPLARYFLDRAAVKMPAFRRHLLPGDLDALWRYVTWLRTGAPAGRHEAAGNGGAGD